MKLERFTEIRSELTAFESALLAFVRSEPNALSPFHIDVLRYIFSFARLTVIQDCNGQDLEVCDAIAPHRWWIVQTCQSSMTPEVNPEQLKASCQSMARTQQQRSMCSISFPALTLTRLRKYATVSSLWCLVEAAGNMDTLGLFVGHGIILTELL